LESEKYEKELEAWSAKFNLDKGSKRNKSISKDNKVEKSKGED